MSLTIVTVVKNDEIGLRQTFESSYQSDNRLSYLIVTPFDNSETYLLAKSLSQSNNKVQVVEDSGAGIYSAMNIALEHVKEGDWVWFLNAGDEIFRLEDIHFLLSFLPGLNLNVKSFYFGYLLCESNGEIIEERHPAQYFSKYKQLFSRNFVSHQTFIARLETLVELGGFDLRYQVASDWDLICRISSKYPPVRCDRLIVKFKLGGYSSQRRNLSNLELLKIRQRLLPKRYFMISFSWFVYRYLRNNLLGIVEFVYPKAGPISRLQRARVRKRLDKFFKK